MSELTRRERLRRAYEYEEMDRPAVYSRTGYPRNDPSYDRLKAYLAGHSELKLGWSGRQFETSYETRVETEPYSEDFQREVTWLVTPKGDLRKTRLVGLKGQPGLAESHYINCREDAQKYLSLPMPSLEGDVSSFLRRSGRSETPASSASAWGPMPAMSLTCAAQPTLP